MTVHPVILSGGVGSRLWPLSRRARPKQLANLTGDATMLQATARRAADLSEAAPPIVVCGSAHADEAQRQLVAVGIEPARLILEPVGRNTAPAIAAAAGTVDPNDLLLVLPADHVVADQAAFAAAVDSATGPAEDGRLVTFGITPTRPATGYGYIEHGPELSFPGAESVVRFVEKPDEPTAQGYVTSGNFSWNAGMFLMQAGTYLAELTHYRPDIARAAGAAVRDATREGIRVQLDPERFAACPSESIDYAVMERTERAAVVRLDAGWSDVGSWSALLDLADADVDGNAVSGTAYLEGVRNSLVRAGDRPVVVIGLDGVIVVDAGDAVLVVDRNHAEAVKQIVERLDGDGRPEV